MDIAVRRHFIKTPSSYAQLICHQRPNCLPTQHFAVIESFSSAVLKFPEFLLSISIDRGWEVNQLLTVLNWWQDWGTSKLKGLCSELVLLWSWFLTFRTRLTATWIHAATSVCSSIKVNQYSWQAWFLFLFSSSPKTAQKCCILILAVTNISLCRRTKVIAVNPNYGFTVDYLRWCFLKKSPFHTWTKVHITSSGHVCLSHYVCCHQ